MSRIDIDAIEDEWEDDAAWRRPGRSLSDLARRRLAEHDVSRVVAVDRGRVTVVDEAGVREARYGGSMRGERVVVGDRVRVTEPRHQGDVPRVVELLRRDTVLTRTADDTVDEERVVVANADQVVVVLAADHLDVGARFLDRVLVAALAGGLDTAVCINKADLVGPDVVTPTVERYAAIGVPAVLTSAKTGAGLEELEERIAGCWSAFAGHSGVGKSSLFNIIVPEAEREVGPLGRYGGRHTTVSARAMHVPDVDAWLVDTPGVRSFGLGHVDPRDLGRLFPELAELDCALDDCAHDGEPGCALADASVDPLRLASYRRLLAALRGADPWAEDADGPAGGEVDDAS